MASRETILVRVAIILSVVLVMALGVLAIYSVLDREAGSEEADDGGSEEADDGSATDRAYPGPNVAIEDLERPLTVGCVTNAGPDNDFSVLITNRSGSAVDYVVAVRLGGDDGSRITSVEVPDLGPGEIREVGVPRPTASDSNTDCSIAGIQSDRRILLAAP